ncbi:MAG: hypothetical protein J6Y02_04595 [Pseudobutyrivibrio sp.]|nr:hypothetical protein [Pseudobutyrivibrio sp.]
MQYSPYSATMNPYQTIYNNGGAGAYQPTWGYSDLFAHTLDIDSTLPLGYTRQQYNEERALAAESMWKSPLLGLQTFAVGTAASHVIFGSPLQNLSRLVGGVQGASAFNTGFNGAPAFSDLWSARQNMLEAGRNWRAGLQGLTPEGSVASLRQDYVNAKNTWQALNRQSQAAITASGTFWGKVGTFSRNIADFKSAVQASTETLIRGGGNVLGSVVKYSTQAVGSTFETALDISLNGAVSPWLKNQGTSLVNLANNPNGWIAKASEGLGKITELESNLAKATEAFRGAKTAAEATKLEAGVIKATKELEQASKFGSLGRSWTKLKGGLANSVKSIGQALKSGNGISKILGAGIGNLTTGAIGLASPILSSFLNPVTMAEMYLLDQTIGYTTDTYQNYQTENEIKRNLMAKGGRILQYGFADGARGLQGGFSVSQQDQLVSTIRKMAAVGASQGDVFGLGADSLFGGHTRYSERLRELKSILNVGTDMGFFDMSRSMDDFEKKFKQTVETVDKLAKMLKRTKGEIMTVMANVQNTEGLYSMGAINASVLKKDYASRLSGVDLTTAMQESAAGAQMGRQHGFSAAMGANLMSDSRILMSNALRSGDLTREDIFRLGGEQGVVTNLQQGYLNAMDDPVVQAELAMGMVRDPATGKMTFSADRLKRLATASDAELRRMSRERTDFMTTKSYSRIRQATFAGGKMYDAMRYLRTALAKGEVSQDQYNMAIAGAVRQKMLRYHMDESSAQYQETLRLELEGLTGDPTTAGIIAKQMLGGYAGMQAHNDFAVAVDRYRSGYDKSGFGFMTMLNASSNNMGRGAGLLGAAFVGGIATVASGGAAGLIGATVGYNIGQGIYTGVGILANRIDPTSNLALGYRDQIKQELRAKGINPNYVDTYLFGKSDIEKLSEYSSEQLSAKLAIASKFGMISSKYAGTDDYSSVRWRQLKEGSTAFSKESDTKKTSLIQMAIAANNASGKGVNGTLAGYLNYYTNDLIKEFGLNADEVKALKGIQKAIRDNDTFDTTELGNNVDLRKLGRVIETSISAGVKGGLDRGTMVDTLMNTLQTETTDFWTFGKSKVTEAFLKEKSAGVSARELIKGKAGFWGNFLYGASTNLEERIAKRGSMFSLDYTKENWGKGLAATYFLGLLGRWDLAGLYLDSDAKKQYLEKYKSALAIDDQVAADLYDSINTPSAKGRAWLASNISKINPYLDDSVFAQELEALKAYAGGEDLTSKQQKLLKTFSTNLIGLKYSKELESGAKKAMASYASREDANNKTSLDEDLTLLAGYLSVEGKEKFKGKDARAFLKSMLVEAGSNTDLDLWSKDEQTRIRALLEKKDSNDKPLSDAELLKSASTIVVNEELVRLGKKEEDAKGKVDYNSGTGDTLKITAQTAELCHSSAVLLDSVVRRLGY